MASAAGDTDGPRPLGRAHVRGVDLARGVAVIYGIAAIADSHVFTASAHYVVGNLRAWGWITLIIGVLQLLAAAGVLAGNQLARWSAVAVIGLNAIDQMFFIPARGGR